MPAEDRAKLLLKAMNLSEKVRMMHGSHSEDKSYGWYVGRAEGNPRLGIPNLQLNDGPQGFRDMNDSHSGTTTAWPSGLGVAATWDVAMAGLWGTGMGKEFAGKGSNVQLGPGLCIARVPQDGRNFEYMRCGSERSIPATLTGSLTSPSLFLSHSLFPAARTQFSEPRSCSRQ